MRGWVRPGQATSAQPVWSCLISSGCTANSRPRVRVPVSPFGALAVEAVVGALGVHPGAAGAGDGGDLLGAVGDDLAVSDEGGDVAQDLVLEVGVLDQGEVGELLGAQQQAHAGRAPAAEQPGDAVRGDGGELVDQDQGGRAAGVGGGRRR